LAEQERFCGEALIAKMRERFEPGASAAGTIGVDDYDETIAHIRDACACWLNASSAIVARRATAASCGPRMSRGLANLEGQRTTHPA